MDLPGRGGGKTSLVAKYCKFIVKSVDRRKGEGVLRCLPVACINCTCAFPPCSLLQPMFWMFVAYIQGGRGGTNNLSICPPPNCVSRLGVPHNLKMVSPGPHWSLWFLRHCTHDRPNSFFISRSSSPNKMSANACIL